VITMFLCDGGLDLCSNTLSSSLISLPIGPFTEDFVFDFVNNFIDVPDNVPLLKGTAFLETSNPTDFSSASVMLYDSLGVQFGFSTPFAPHGSNYQAQADDLILPGTGYYVEVKGVSVPIRLTQTPATCRVHPRAGIKVGIGQRSGRNAGRQSR
jgi:hypothetical protein